MLVQSEMGVGWHRSRIQAVLAMALAHRRAAVDRRCMSDLRQRKGLQQKKPVLGDYESD
jgi:hypothetical protein